MIWLRAFALALALAGVSAPAAAADLGPSVAAVADLLGCSTLDRERLALGELVSVRSVHRPLDEAAAVIVTISPVQVFGAMTSADLFHVDRRVEAAREIPLGPTNAAMFASLPVYLPSYTELGGGEPELEWNLSVTERALLRDVERDGEGARAVAEAIRHIWAERTAAYRSGGTRAIAPYARTEGAAVFAAGAEAAQLWTRYARLEALAPGFHAAVAAYPQASPPNLRHSFYGSVVQLGGGPATVLSHRMESTADTYAVGMEREFYVSRVYGVRQTILGAASIPDGRAIAFYFTSVAGAVSAPEIDEGPNNATRFLAALRAVGK